MTRRWNTSVQCVRKFCPSEPDKCKGCERCEGKVSVKGYYEAASMYGGADHTGWPAESESEAGKCDTCGYDDWDSDELDALTEAAQQGAD